MLPINLKYITYMILIQFKIIVITEFHYLKAIAVKFVSILNWYAILC